MDVKFPPLTAESLPQAFNIHLPCGNRLTKDLAMKVMQDLAQRGNSNSTGILCDLSVLL